MNKLFHHLKQFTKLLPLITVGLIALGYADLYFFYEPYDIIIYHYLDLSEIIFSFVSLPHLFFVFPIYIAGIYWLSSFIPRKVDSIEAIWKSFTILTAICTPFFIGSIWMMYQAEDGFSIWFFFYPMIISFGGLFLTVASFIFLKIDKPTLKQAQRFIKRNVKIAGIMIIFVILMGVFPIKRNHDFKIMMENKSNDQLYKFKYESDSIITSNQLLYIGMTNRYIFFYDKKSSTSKIYSLVGIKQILLNRKSPTPIEKVIN